MAIYAISDLHLSFAEPKPMDVFGPAWVDHPERIRRNWDLIVTGADLVLLPGDLSWAMRLPEAMPDLEFVAERPGRKVLVRGNHDYWWQRRATSRIQRIVDRNLTFLQGTSVVMDGAGITGTRGWRVDWEAREGVHGSQFTVDSGEQQPDRGALAPSSNAQPDRILLRELEYLERGLRSIPESASPRIAMLHFPPFDERLRPNEFADLLARYSVDILVYGHVHLGLGSWIEGAVGGVRYYMVSADVADFTPQLIVP